MRCAPSVAGRCEPAGGLKVATPYSCKLFGNIWSMCESNISLPFSWLSFPCTPFFFPLVYCCLNRVKAAHVRTDLLCDGQGVLRQTDLGLLPSSKTQRDTDGAFASSHAGISPHRSGLLPQVFYYSAVREPLRTCRIVAGGIRFIAIRAVARSLGALTRLFGP